MINGRVRAPETFNARFLEPSRVGATFVATPFLALTARPEHTAILGPRGSGKTTLLKMLTLAALRSWEHTKKREFASALGFLAVYIPASITWSSDYRGFTNAPADRGTLDLISISLFRHSVLVALLTAYEELAEDASQVSPLFTQVNIVDRGLAEPPFCRLLARAWSLSPGASTAAGLRQLLNDRIRTLQRLSVEAGILNITSRELIRDYPFVSAHFIDDATSFLDTLTECLEFSSRLCLCFDELEIAPKAVVQSIMQAPRSIDQRIFVKFSAAPYVGAARETNADPTVASEQNDFRLVFLSSFASSKIRPFSEALFRSLCYTSGVMGTADEILGLSFLEDDPLVLKGRLSASSLPERRYGPEGSRQRKYQALYERDRSFRSYADEKGLDVHDLSFGSEKRRAAAVRKILWPVLIREEFLFVQEAAGNQRRRLRSKDAVSDIYTGAGSIFALCEGNPRWLIGLLQPMIDGSSSSPTGKPVPRSLQKQLVEKMIASYFALLSTIPGRETAGKVESLVGLVDRIGRYFRESVLGPAFNPDPVLSFFVDDAVAGSARDLIGRGINMGAFVTTQDVQGDDSYVVGEIAGLKVRLSNMLAPHFRLPLSGGRTINLSTILYRSRGSTGDTLFELFGQKI